MAAGDSKTCTKCGEGKPLSEYYFEKGKPRSSCKTCHKAKLYAQRQDRDAFNAKRRAYTASHPDKIRAQSAKYWAQHKDDINAFRRQDRQENPDKYLPLQRASWQRRKDKVNAARREAWESDPEVRARKTAWEKAHPEKVKEYAAKRVAQMTDAERDARNAYNREYYAEHSDQWNVYRRRREARLAAVDYQPYTRAEIFERDGGECRGCRKELANEPHAFQIDHIVPVSLGGPDIPANLQLMCPRCNRAKWASLEGQIHLPV